MRSMAISNPKSPSGRRSSRTPTSVLRTSEWDNPDPRLLLAAKRVKAWTIARPRRGIYEPHQIVEALSAQNDSPGMTRPRKLYVKSFGCQMNVYDSHRMADMLAPEGFAETAQLEDADLVILNTCHIREKAADKVYSELGRMRVLKEAAARNGRRVTIAVAGCVAQAEGEEIVRRAPVVDLVVGPQNYHRLPGLLVRAEREGA